MTEKTIREWHTLLHNRFTALRDERDITNPGSPVFALEHGLDLATELGELEDAVRNDIVGRQISKHAWLPLIVYAAEIGYRYEGQEYWPEFDDTTPGWKQRWPNGRAFIRSKYDSFALTYGGAQPKGRWASNFTIISWPITHAVLPKDLQKHLARLLSEYRRVFTSELLEDHQELGKWLEVRCHDTSSRFRVFAENTELLGLVAASLLLGDEDETPLLSEEVLHRIVQDLNQERQSGVWLRNAKRSAVQIRRRGFLGKSKSSRRDTFSRISEDVWPKLELDLSLRLSTKGWTAYVAVPSFTSLTIRFPEIRDEVERRRYRVKGVRGVRARGALMYEQGPLVLETMPTPGQTPLTVEGASEALSRRMTDHCRMPDDPWLFRFDEAGPTKEVRTKFVRPGQKYVLMTLEPVSASDLTQAEPVAITTGGVHALKFDVPDDIDDAFVNTMKQLGIGVVSDIAVWPAGLVSAFWDGEGRASWLAGEDPMIGIRSTRRISRCVISHSEDVGEFVWPEGDDCIFLQFTGLRIGTHLVDVHLFISDDPKKEIAKGEFELRLLEPVNSSAKAGARQAIQTRVHPARPTLEELWDGSAALEVSGPYGEKVDFDVRLTTLNGRNVLTSKSFSSDMPVDEDRWRELLKGKQDSDFSLQYGQAEEIHIIASNPVLGKAEVIAERPFEPLRWVTGVDQNGPFAHLIDHAGSGELEVNKYDIATPDTPSMVSLNEDGEFRSSDGGLLVAHVEKFKTAVVLSPHISGGGFAMLSKLDVQPILRENDRSPSAISTMVELARLWTHVGIPANALAAQQQTKVNDAIVASISEIITGKRWGRIEQDIFKGNLVLENKLIQATTKSPQEYATAKALLSEAAQTGKHPDERVDVFSSILESHGWCELTGQTVPKYVEPILRLATVPGALDPKDSAAIDDAIRTTLRVPAVHRLARFFVLVLDGRHMDPYAPLLEGWPWP